MSDLVNANDPFDSLGEVTIEDVKSVEKASGLSYDNYISIPKNEVLPLLRVVDFLSKVAVDHYTKNINILSTKEQILFRFNNDPYLLEYSIPNKAGKTIKNISIPTVHLRKLLANVITNIVLVEKDNQINICIGDNLLYVETTPFEAQHYEFNFPSCDQVLNLNYIKDHLKSFASLLSCSERTSQKNIICKEGISYIDAGAILGKAKSFFGDMDLVVSQTVINSIAELAGETKSAIKVHLQGNTMTMEFVGLAKFQFNVTVGDGIEEFISPMFKESFEYKDSALIVNETFKQMLTSVGSLDYFTSFVSIDFKESEFILTIRRKEGGPIEYAFRYLEGSVKPSQINVEIPVILAVLSKATNETKYSTASGNLIVDLGDVVYCIRTVS